MDFPELISGEFVRRENRFMALVRLDGQVVPAHLPNSGRLTDLLVPGAPVWVAPAAGPLRKTACDFKLVEHAGVLVSVDARLPADLFVEALQAGRVPGFNPGQVEREVSLGDSRLDLRLRDFGRTCWVETKSVTLVTEGVALFPDAPTRRGRRHIHELAVAVRAGDQAAVVFVVQRPDALSFSPHREADPDFVAGLRQAAAAGVRIKAYTCHVTCSVIHLLQEIPVKGV